MESEKIYSANQLKIILGTIIANAEQDASDTLPESPAKGAVWWMHCQAPQREKEPPQAYTERLTTNLRTFLSLDRQGRRFIAEARQSGIYWFGEPIRDFAVIANIAKAIRKPTYFKKMKYRASLVSQYIIASLR